MNVIYIVIRFDCEMFGLMLIVKNRFVYVRLSMFL